MDEIVGAENVANRTSPDSVDHTGLKIDQNGARHVLVFAAYLEARLVSKA